MISSVVIPNPTFYKFHVVMKFGRVYKPRREFMQYFRAETVLEAKSEEEAISFAYSRAQSLIRSGYEIQLSSCERIGKVE